MLSKRQFYQEYCSRDIKQDIKKAAIWAFVAFITLCINFLGLDEYDGVAYIFNKITVVVVVLGTLVALFLFTPIPGILIILTSIANAVICFFVAEMKVGAMPSTCIGIIAGILIIVSETQFGKVYKTYVASSGGNMNEKK